MKQKVRKILGLLPDKSFGFYLTDFLFRKVLRQNARVRWAIHHSSTIHNPDKLTVGKATFPGDSPGVYINAYNGVHVGDFTNLGPNVAIVSANHDLINNDLPVAGEPIHIGNFCWLGFGAVILPGTRLGNFTIVGANAVVTKSFEEGYIVIAGNPAKVIRRLDKQECDEQATRKYEAFAAGQ